MQGYVVEISTSKPDAPYVLEAIFAMRKLASGSAEAFKRGLKNCGCRPEIGQIIIDNAEAIHKNYMRAPYTKWEGIADGAVVSIKVWKTEIF